MKKILILFVLLVIALPGCGQGGAAVENGGQEQIEVVNDNRDYTLEEYLQINVGDSYEDVCGLLGVEGDVVVDNERLKQYQWTNEDKTSINITFYDGVVTAKTHDGLGPLLSGAQAVTLNKYEKLKEGMSLEEVTDILGPGTEFLLTTGEGQEMRYYIWKNRDGGRITITLEGDKVTRITEMMLK